MNANMDQIEIERIVNLTRGFDWEKVSEEITDTHVLVTFKKKRVSPEPELGVGPG